MKQLVLLLLVCMLSASAIAQSKVGMHFEDGVWKKPTPQSALDALLMGNEDADHLPAVAMLRQQFDTWSAAELGVISDELGRIVREGTEVQSMLAYFALVEASMDVGEGARYPGVADIFIQIYESYENRLSPEASSALLGVYQSGDEDYVRDLFETSEQPPACQGCGGLTRVDCEEVANPCPNVCTWCQAGHILVTYGHDRPDVELWRDLCWVDRH